MEERAVNNGVVTTQTLRSTVDVSVVDSLQRIGLMDFMRRLESQQEPAPRHQEEQPPSSLERSFQFDRGRFYRISPSFTVPRLNLLLAFQLWCCGSEATDNIPLRNLSCGEFRAANQKKRFNEYRFLMETIENELLRCKKCIPSPTISQVNDMFKDAEHVFFCIAYTEGGKKRRLSQLAWATAAKEFRKFSTSA